ncbi:replication initiation protein [Vibrio tasmaniensis]|uniref:replication initiation protein n=1 Tax=Vibrio tasmaniensis TaxID=212663 RepID=UPI001F22FE38|nr:replication initiation protein [Vibrio tasmaniensis]
MNKRIYHHNDAHLALIDMHISARRILYICLGDMKRERDVDTQKSSIQFDPEQVFTIQAQNYANLCGLSRQEGYKQLKEGVEEITRFSVRVPKTMLVPISGDLPDDFVNVFGSVSVASAGGYSNGHGFIKVKLAPEFAPYISNLTENFTSQFLLHALRLPQGNAYSLYLLLSKWIGEGKSQYCDITVEELKSGLGVLKGEYERFDLFKSAFFKRAVKQVVSYSEFTDVSLEILSRQGRKAHIVRVSYLFDKPKFESNPVRNVKDSVDKNTIRESDKKEGVITSDKERIELEIKKLEATKKLSPSDRFRLKTLKKGKWPTY